MWHLRFAAPAVAAAVRYRVLHPCILPSCRLLPLAAAAAAAVEAAAEFAAAAPVAVAAAGRLHPQKANRPNTPTGTTSAALTCHHVIIRSS